MKIDEIIDNLARGTLDEVSSALKYMYDSSLDNEDAYIDLFRKACDGEFNTDAMLEARRFMFLLRIARIGREIFQQNGVEWTKEARGAVASSAYATYINMKRANPYVACDILRAAEDEAAREAAMLLTTPVPAPAPADAPTPDAPVADAMPAPAANAPVAAGKKTKSKPKTKPKSKKARARATRAHALALPVPAAEPVPPTPEPTQVPVDAAPVTETPAPAPVPVRVVAWLTRHAPTPEQSAWWQQRDIQVRTSAAFAEANYAFANGTDVAKFASDAAGDAELVAVVAVLPPTMIQDAIKGLGKTPLVRAVMNRVVDPQDAEKVSYEWAGTWEQVVKVVIETAPFDIAPPSDPTPTPAPPPPPPPPSDPTPTPDTPPTPPDVPPAPNAPDVPTTTPAPAASTPADAPPSGGVTPETADASAGAIVTKAAFNRMSDSDKIAYMQRQGALAVRPEDASRGRPYVGVIRRQADAKFGFIGNVFVPPNVVCAPYNVRSKELKDSDLIVLTGVEKTDKGLRAKMVWHYPPLELDEFAQKLPDGVATPRPYTGELVPLPEGDRRDVMSPFKKRHDVHCSPLADGQVVTHVPAEWTGDMSDYVVAQDLRYHKDGDWRSWAYTDTIRLADGFVARQYYMSKKSQYNDFFDEDLRAQDDTTVSWVICALPVAVARALGVVATLEDALTAFAGNPEGLWRWMVAARIRRATVPKESRERLAEALGAVQDAETPARFDFPPESPFAFLFLERDAAPTLWVRDPEAFGGRRKME